MRQLLTVILVLTASGTSGWAARPEFNVDCFFGWGEVYRPMEWTPIDVRINSNLNEPFAGILHISTRQDGLNTLNVSQPFVLTPDMSLQLPMATKIAFGTSDCEVTLFTDRGRKVWSNKYNLFNYDRNNERISTLDENDLLIGLIGRAKYGVRRLADSTSSKADPQKYQSSSGNQGGQVYIGNKIAAMAPWDWAGYSTLDALILYDPDWSLFREDQLNAICQWVSNGGRLFVILGSRVPANDNPIRRILPVEIDDMKEINIPTDALQELGLDSSKPETVAAWPMTERENARYCVSTKIDNGRILYACGYVGFGRAAVLGLDPANLSDRQKNKTDKFWVNRLQAVLEDNKIKSAGRSIKLGKDENSDDRYQHSYNISQAQKNSNSVMEYLYNIRELTPLSIWWVILLLTALALLLGPVDYIILKKRDKLPLTWLTSAGWIIVFTIGAYYGVQALRGGKMQCRVVSIQDGIAGGYDNWSTTYSGLFAPYSDVYELEGLDKKQWWSGIAPSEDHMYYYNQQTAGRKINCVQMDGGNLPSSLPINIWTMQCLLTESPQSRLPILASVKRQGDVVTCDFTNLSNKPVSKLCVMFDKDKGVVFENIPAETTKQLTGKLKRQSIDRLFQIKFEDYFSNRRDYDRRGSGRYTDFNLIEACRAQGTYRRTDVIDAYLAHGAAAVYAEYEDVPTPYKVKKKNCQYNHIQLVRQIVFPNEIY